MKRERFDTHQAQRTPLQRERMQSGTQTRSKLETPLQTPSAPQRAPWIKLIVDSGAFTAWNSGIEVDIKAYSDYLERNRAYISHGVSLDVIPGRPRSIRHRSDYIEAAAKSYANHQWLKERGHDVIPVYHQGEPLSVLERYMRDGETYVGVSPDDTTPRNEQRRWLDATFHCLCNGRGQPLVKTHGFGIANVPFIRRYPWTTIDSTAWILGMSYGALMLPSFDRNGDPDWDAAPDKVIVSAPGYDAKTARKYENLGPLKQQHVSDYLENVIGCSVSRSRYDTYWRRRVAVHYLESFTAAARELPARISTSFLDSLDLSDRSAIVADRRIVYAITTARDRSMLLNDCKLAHRLLSYSFLSKLPEETTAHYVVHGQFLGEDHKPPFNHPKRGEQWSVTYCNVRALALLDRIAEYDKRGDLNEA
jgi:hypothetical protein